MSAPYRPGPRRPSLPEQIPPVAGDVDEHGDASVRHLTNGGDELDARSVETRARGVEVVDPEEEPDAASRLVADDR